MNLKHFFSLLFCSILFSQCVPPTEEILTDIKVDFKNKDLRKIYNFQDQQQTDSLFRYFRHKDPTYRYLAAMAFGSIKDPTALDSLERLLRDPIEEVKIAAAYAIGQIGEKAAEDNLIAAFDQFDSLGLKKRVNATILEAIGKCGSEDFLEALSTIKSYETTDTILLEGQAWGIYRYAYRDITSRKGTERMVELVTDKAYPGSVRFIAANYLSRTKNLRLSNVTDELEEAFVKEDDPRIRMTLAIALGKAKTTSAKNSLIYQYHIERDYRVKCNILRALKNYEYDDIKATVLEAVKNENWQVGYTATEVLLEKGDAKEATSYWRLAKDSLHWQVQLGLYAAANHNLPAYFSESKKFINWELKRRFENAKNPYEKAAALSALAEYGWNYRYIKQSAFASDIPVIRTESIRGLAKICQVEDFRKFFGSGYRKVRKELANYFVEAVENGDVGMMAEAAIILRDPSLYFKGTIDSLNFLESALTSLELPKEIETYNEINKTLAYFKSEPEPKPRKPEIKNNIEWRRLDDLSKDGKAKIKTNKGIIVLKFLTNEAPGTVANFLKLMGEEFFKDKTFHRVVSNFVIQGGCPRGDGYGSLNYAIRSELPKLNYDKQGYVGMASAGNHTECTQFFITHSPTPHLDGGYTIFAEVLEGMDVVHNIEVGDRIEEVTME